MKLYWIVLILIGVAVTVVVIVRVKKYNSTPAQQNATQLNGSVETTTVLPMNSNNTPQTR